MIYAILVFVVALSLVLLIAFKPKIREEYALKIPDFNKFEADYSAFVKSLPLPKSETARLNETYYKSQIRRVLRRLASKRYRGIFDEILRYKPEIKQLLAKSFEALSPLPTTYGIPRIVKIVEFCVQSSQNPLDTERIAAAFNVQNAFRTLSYAEISAAKDAIRYVFLKRVAVVLQNMEILSKMKRIADKYKKDPASLSLDKNYRALKDNKLFLSFCADNANFDSAICNDTREEFLTKAKNELAKIFSACDTLDRVDFERFYAPMQIFSRYDAFLNASEIAKRNFLSLVQELSDRENIDEYLFAIRVDNYLKSANFGHIKILRTSLFGKRSATVLCGKDISTLGAGLSSDILMNLIFGGRNKQNDKQSTLNNGKIENSFEKLIKYSNVNFGITTKNDRLKISPSLPTFIKKADLCISHKGTEHKVHIKRGEERALYLGQTKLTGTSNIVLSDKPLDVTCIIEDK